MKAAKSKTGAAVAGDGAAFARAYKPVRTIKCSVCRSPKAAKFVAEVAQAMEADEELWVPIRVLRDELEARFNYHCVATALGRHIKECIRSKAWEAKHGGAR